MSEANDRILAYLLEHGPSRTRDIHPYAFPGMSRERAQAYIGGYLNKLMKTGQVKRMGRGLYGLPLHDDSFLEDKL